jgi:programmed cell death protein 5
MENDSSEEKQLETLRRRVAEQQQAQQEAEQAQEQLENALRFLLEPNAKQRLSNVRIANKPLYLRTAQALLMLYKSGQINGKISETELKKLLEKMSEKREPKITRK